MYSVGLSSAANKPPASTASNENRILLIQSRGDLHFAALLASVLRGLLVVELAFDKLLEIRPGIAADEPAPVQERGRRAVYAERFSFRDGGVHFRFGGVGIQAPAELHAVKLGNGFGEIRHLRFQIVRRDLNLLAVDPVEILPERGRVLAEYTTAGHGGGFCPRMNGFERKILEVDSNLVGERGLDILPDGLRFHLEIGAF